MGHRIRTVCLAALLLLSPASSPVFAGESVGDSFERFCSEWMQKLATRERDNQQHIQWIPSGNGVMGEYVGYSTDHTCQLKALTDPKAVPVAKILYQEIRYQKSGPSPTAASTAPPQPLDLTEVTEIFRYEKGQWKY
jgi:hypothetical protein